MTRMAPKATRIRSSPVTRFFPRWIRGPDRIALRSNSTQAHATLQLNTFSDSVFRFADAPPVKSKDQPKNHTLMNVPNELPKDRGLLKLAATPLLFLLAALPVNAQQVNGVPGSPSATTTIDGKYVPTRPGRLAA